MAFAARPTFAAIALLATSGRSPRHASLRTMALTLATSIASPISRASRSMPPSGRRRTQARTAIFAHDRRAAGGRHRPASSRWRIAQDVRAARCARTWSPRRDQRDARSRAIAPAVAGRAVPRAARSSNERWQPCASGTVAATGRATLARASKLSQRRADARASLDAHRAGAQPDAQRVRHASIAKARSAQARAADAALAQGDARAARRRSDRAQGHLRDRGLRTTCGSRMLANFTAPVRRARRRPARRRRHGARRQDQHGRVRDGLVQRELVLRPGHAIRGTPSACRAAARAARRRRSRRASCRRRPAPTPAARSASRRRCRASAGSSRPTACARATA